MIEYKKIILKQNGNTSSKGKVIKLFEQITTLKQFKEILYESYGIEQCDSFTLFNQSGIEVTDDMFILIKDGEIVYYEVVQRRGFDFNNIFAQYEVLERLG